MKIERAATQFLQQLERQPPISGSQGSAIGLAENPEHLDCPWFSADRVFQKWQMERGEFSSAANSKIGPGGVASSGSYSFTKRSVGKFPSRGDRSVFELCYWECMAKIASENGKPATVKFFKRYKNGARFSALWLLARDHNLRHRNDLRPPARLASLVDGPFRHCGNTCGGDG